MSSFLGGGGGGGSGTPGGANTDIQFNDSASFGGAANFTYNKATGQVALTTTTDASSTTTGAEVNSGGLGVAKNLYVGSDVNLPVSSSTVGRVFFGAKGVSIDTHSNFFGVTPQFTISGAQNVCIGLNVAAAATTAANNVVLGTDAVQSGIFTGSNNVVFGTFAGKNMTSGGGNVIMSTNAGGNISTGSNNICIGGSTIFNGASLLTGAGNVALGVSALQKAEGAAAQNLAIGSSSMAALTTGGSNVGIGQSGLSALTTGSSNVSVGNNNGTTYTGAESSNVLIGGSIAGTLGESNTVQIGDGAGNLRLDYGHTNANGWSLASGFVVGAATGGYLGAGTINVSTGISLNNTAYTNPDYVLEHHYTGKVSRFAHKPRAESYPGLMPLKDLRDFTEKNWHLPRISREPSDIFERGDMALEKIEELTLYILELESRIAALEAR